METARVALIHSAASTTARFFARFTTRRSDLSPSTTACKKLCSELLGLQVMRFASLRGSSSRFKLATTRKNRPYDSSILRRQGNVRLVIAAARDEVRRPATKAGRLAA